MLYRDIEEALPGHEIASFFRMGNWIGGDRDGNPFVGAATLRTAFARQSETALRHYLTQVHELGAELSNSATLQPVSPAMQRARRRLGRRQPAPRGRAVPARADRRLRAPRGDAARAHRHRGAAPCGARRASPTPTAEDFLADLRTIEASLRCAPRRGAGAAAPRAADPRGAGVRLPPRHRRPAPELRQARGGRRRAARGGPHRARLLGARRSGAPPRCCSACSTMRGRCASSRARAPTAYSEASRDELGDLRARRRDAARASAARRCATASSRTPRASATCSRCSCC